MKELIINIFKYIEFCVLNILIHKKLYIVPIISKYFSNSYKTISKLTSINTIISNFLYYHYIGMYTTKDGSNFFSNAYVENIDLKYKFPITDKQLISIKNKLNTLKPKYLNIETVNEYNYNIEMVRDIKDKPKGIVNKRMRFFVKYIYPLLINIQNKIDIIYTKTHNRYFKLYCTVSDYFSITFKANITFLSLKLLKKVNKYLYRFIYNINAVGYWLESGFFRYEMVQDRHNRYKRKGITIYHFLFCYYIIVEKCIGISNDRYIMKPYFKKFNFCFTLKQYKKSIKLQKKLRL